MVCGTRTVAMHHLQSSCDLFITAFYFSEFFKLMNEVENEDLVFTLETIVDKFGEEMAPYALGLCQNLVIILFHHPDHRL